MQKGMYCSPNVMVFQLVQMSFFSFPVRPVTLHTSPSCKESNILSVSTESTKLLLLLCSKLKPLATEKNSHEESLVVSDTVSVSASFLEILSAYNSRNLSSCFNHSSLARASSVDADESSYADADGQDK